MARTMRQADAAEISMCCRAGASSAGDAVAPARQIKKSGSKEDRHEAFRWSQPTSNDAAYRRAGGRARYNLKRFDVAFKRRQSLLLLLRHKAPGAAIWRIWRGSSACRKATICRDVAQLHRSKSLGPADPTFAQILREMNGPGFDANKC